MDSRQEERPEERRLSQEVGRKADRRMRATRRKDRSLWFGLGAFGVVGWSVAVPTLVGIALGVWLDARMDDPFSWTLMLLILGICVGCANAWFWVSRAEREIRRDREEGPGE
jgi:ATP synthase protein I